MHSWPLFLVFAFVSLSLQSVWPITANLLLIAVLFLGFEEEKASRGLTLSLLIGFLLDCVSVAPIGSSLLSFGLVFVTIRFLRTKIVLLSLPLQFFWIVVLTLLKGLITYLWLQIWDFFPRPFLFYFKHQLFSGLINGGLSWFLFPLLRALSRLTWEKLFPRRDPLLRR